MVAMWATVIAVVSVQFKSGHILENSNKKYLDFSRLEINPLCLFTQFTDRLVFGPED